MKDYNALSATEIMGWEITAGNYCERINEYHLMPVMLVSDWKPIEDANQLMMIIEKMTKEKFDVDIAIREVGYIVEIERSGKHIPKDDWVWVEKVDKDLAIAVIEASLEAIEAKGVTE